MIGNQVFSFIRVPKWVKITSAAHYLFLESILLLGLADVPISKRCELKIHDDYAQSHSGKKTQVFLSLFELEGDFSIERPAY